MQIRTSNRSWPHPVLAANRDDIFPYQSTATVEVAIDGPRWRIEGNYLLNHSTIDELLKEKKVARILHVESRELFFRKAIRCFEETFAVHFHASELAGRIEVTPMVVACENLQDYQPAGLHQDYGETSFQIQRGDILAVSECQMFDLELQEKDIKNIRTIFQVTDSSDPNARECHYDFDHDDIVLMLPGKSYQIFCQLHENSTVQAPLSNLLVLPALTEILAQVSREGGDFSGRRWFQILERELKLRDIPIDVSMDCFSVAQKLLNLPVDRSYQQLLNFVEVVE